MRHLHRLKRQDRARDTACDLYVIRIGGTDIHKIGVSQNVEKRMETLRANTWRPFDLVTLVRFCLKKDACRALDQVLTDLSATGALLRGDWARITTARLLATIETTLARTDLDLVLWENVDPSVLA